MSTLQLVGGLMLAGQTSRVDIVGQAVALASHPSWAWGPRDVGRLRCRWLP